MPAKKNNSTSSASDLKTFTQYKIQHANLLSELEKAVGELVALGWIPSGGIVYVPRVSIHETNAPLSGFYQPLVKEG